MTSEQKDEVMQKLSAIWQARGYIVIGSNIPRDIGEITFPDFALEDLDQPMRIMSVTDFADYHQQAQMLGYPRVECMAHYYRVESD